ncbi:hypothetical protein [Streptococcus suis]|uniref:hypothetical protein n=1 Tax=Streptococcus suis TaxID=1307 RepID=UPI000CF434DD|nr:hypothetical protein [Streptococcus suis]
MNLKKLTKLTIFFLMLVLASLLIIFSMMYPGSIRVNQDVLFGAIILPALWLLMTTTLKMVKHFHTNRMIGVFLTFFALLIIILYQIASLWTWYDIVFYHFLSAIFYYVSLSFDTILD